MVRVLVGYGAWGLAWALGLCGIALRFLHPDKTEMRLLYDYWPLWLTVVGLAAVAFACGLRAAPQEH